MIVQLVMLLFLAADGDIAGVRAVFERQQDSWNRGDIAGFMALYQQSDQLIFTSGGTIQRGWQAAMDRFKSRYPDRETMGRLRFSDLEVTLVGPGAAVTLGKWELTRKNDKPHGVFTVILKKENGSWKIIHDHTSQAP
jgi:ketosteroid isomerase-like protein